MLRFLRNLHIKAGSEAEELDKHNIQLVQSLEHFDVYRRRPIRPIRCENRPGP